MSQTQIILKHLETHKSITSLEAINLYGILRLASRIAELKQLGVPIDRTLEQRKRSDGSTVSYARYFLGARDG